MQYTTEKELTVFGRITLNPAQKNVLSVNMWISLRIPQPYQSVLSGRRSSISYRACIED